MLGIYHMHRYMVHIRADLLEMSFLLADSSITAGILTSPPGMWASKTTDRTDEVGRPSRAEQHISERNKTVAKPHFHSKCVFVFLRIQEYLGGQSENTQGVSDSPWRKKVGVSVSKGPSHPYIFTPLSDVSKYLLESWWKATWRALGEAHLESESWRDGKAYNIQTLSWGHVRRRAWTDTSKAHMKDGGNIKAAEGRSPWEQWGAVGRSSTLRWEELFEKAGGATLRQEGRAGWLIARYSPRVTLRLSEGRNVGHTHTKVFQLCLRPHTPTHVFGRSAPLWPALHH